MSMACCIKVLDVGRGADCQQCSFRSETRLKETKEMYPPLIKDIQIVGRFKGHTNIVKSTKFVKDDFSTLVYKLVSCGYDGKIIVWDYKALPKIKKSHLKPTPTSPRERVTF